MNTATAICGQTHTSTSLRNRPDRDSVLEDQRQDNGEVLTVSRHDDVPFIISPS